MPSKSRKQLNLFKIVKGYVDGGTVGLVDVWKEVYPGRKFPTKSEIEKIVLISDRISYADLGDLSSGVDGDENLGEAKVVKVGYWMKFEAVYIKDNKPAKNVFIAKITGVRPAEQIAKFNSEEIYNRFGGRVAPKRSYKTINWLDYSSFKYIEETAKSKEDLVMKNENLREFVRETLNEVAGGLTIKKRGTGEDVSVSTGMFVQKISDESKGKVKNVGIDDSTTPAKNNLNIEWYHGDLAGTTQTVNLDDVEAF